MVSLTADQDLALNNIINFIYSPIYDVKDTAAILQSPAGCGKTFLMKMVVNKIQPTFKIVLLAPTHKARKVIDTMVNKDRLLEIKTMTIASILNKMREHSYIGTKNYVKGNNSKMNLFDVYIIDEASMITDNDVNSIIRYAFENKKKVLFIGDKFQIPNPSQKYICKNGFATKKDSLAFDISKVFELTTIIRQAENNPIINLYTELRKSISEMREPSILYKNNINNDKGVCFYQDENKWYEKFYKLYSDWGEDKHNLRIIAYTNSNVRHHNLQIRRILKRGPTPEIGEILMGYNNLGFPSPVIENSQDYYVTNVVNKENFHIFYKTKVFQDLCGNMITIKETDSNKIAKIFMIDISNENNKDVLTKLVELAERVNKPKSTKDDFKNYCSIKNNLVFMENIYKFNGKIIGETEFKGENPLLFKSVKDIIEDCDDGDRNILENKLSKQISDKYGEILTERLQDDKPISGTERICDKFCVIEKDIDYGICITAHKSQGSSFHTVFIDDSDFDKLQDSWNYDLDCKIKSIKEKNQLKYVAFTRPTHFAHIYKSLSA